jgi:glycerophosphoryl diester phosphodiesterase
VGAAALILAIGAGAQAGAVDLQGHRGARGLAPENTLAGFRRAIAVGVTTLETDLDGIITDYPDRARQALEAMGATID